MCKHTFQPITVLDVVLDRDLSAPARVLDLFTAQTILPEEFDLRRNGEHLRLRMLTPVMVATRYAILIAKLRTIHGVHSVEVRPRSPVEGSAR